MTFQIQALPTENFAPLFALDDAALTAQNAIRVTAHSDSGYPCRVSLTDVPAGTELILLNHAHLDIASPYASRHAIYVSKVAAQATPAPDTVPDMLASRTLSVRAFDQAGLMADADVVAGDALSGMLADYFAKPQIAWVDIHSAARGCFLARAQPSA
jgi:hypothetical protein